MATYGLRDGELPTYSRESIIHAILFNFEEVLWLATAEPKNQSRNHDDACRAMYICSAQW